MIKISNQIIKNLISLTSAEVVSKIIALIIAVYLGRVLKPSGFGILGFATAFVSYFLLMVNFGFDTYGTREIAKDKSILRTLVNNIFSIRLLFAIIWYLIFSIVVFVINKPVTIKIVLLITAINLFVNAISFNWVFMGLEKMWLISIRQILTNIFSLIGIMLFVKSEYNVVIAALIISISGIINSLWLLQVYRKWFYKINLSFNLKFWKEILIESLPLVFSAFMIAIYYNLDMVMLGYMKTQAEVGIYSAAYKILLVGIIPFSLILNSFFPSLSKIGLSNSKEFKKIISQYAFFMFSTGIILTLIIFFNAKAIIIVLFGNRFIKAEVPLLILTVNILVIGTNMFFGNPLIAWGKQKSYSFAILSGAVANIILNILLIPKYSYLGAAFATLISEVVVFLGVFYLFNLYIHKKFIL